MQPWICRFNGHVCNLTFRNGRRQLIFLAWLQFRRADPPTLDELQEAERNFVALKARVAELESKVCSNFFI